MLKKVKVVESKCMNNEVTLEELDNNLRQTTKMASDNEQKLDELSRKLGVQEEELKRAIERAELAENKLKGIEEELQVCTLYQISSSCWIRTRDALRTFRSSI